MSSVNLSNERSVRGDPPGDLDRLAPLAERSLTVLFDLSNRCNLRCRMCYFSYDSVYHRRPIFLVPETFEKVAAELLPFAHTVYLSASNESLTSPHFLAILELAMAYRPPVVKLLTNAQLLDPEIIDGVIELGLSEMHVSMEGATRESYERVRRGASFARLVENVRRVSRRKRDVGSRLPLLQLNVALMRSNLAELERFVDLAVELGVERIACRHLMPYEDLGMEAELTSDEPLHANDRFHAMLEHAARRGISVTCFPDFYAVDGWPWTPPAAVPSEPPTPVAGAPLANPAQPFGRWDVPADDAGRVRRSALLAGWALDRAGIERVEVRRPIGRGDAPSACDERGTVLVGVARLGNAIRPDVTALYPGWPLAYRAGWTFELRRAELPPSLRERVELCVVAHSRSGATGVLGERRIAFDDGTECSGSPGGAPFLFCRKPFDNVYVDAAANVYPYPDCQTVEPFGSLAGEESFRDVWYGDAFRELRRRIVARDPPRMCLTCPDFINRSVDDPAFFRTRPVKGDFLRPAGFLDEPQRDHVSAAPSVRFRGWALGFSPVARIELLCEPQAEVEHGAARRNGAVLVGIAEPGTEARPDVAALHPHYPGRERAGWSFALSRAQLLGPGPFRIAAWAVGVQGSRALLGSATVRFLEEP